MHGHIDFGLRLSKRCAGAGPPINTDTPIMLGLEGRGVRTFAKFVRKATTLQDGDEIIDSLGPRVTVRVTPVAMPFNLFSERFQIGVIAPFMKIDRNLGGQESTSSGIGDARFFAKYLLYQRDRKLETFRVASKATIKLPSGNEEKSPALGTGSTDYAFSTVAGWVKNRIGLYLEGSYNFKTSKDQIDFGNSFGYNLAFGYRLFPAVYETYPSPQLNGFVEINGATAGGNNINGQKLQSTGGTTIFLSPGLQFVGGRRWLIETSLQYPIINEPNGTQLATDWTISLGTRILLF
ncbi:MAG: transporter [bacterium]